MQNQNTSITWKSPWFVLQKKIDDYKATKFNRQERLQNNGTNKWILYDGPHSEPDGAHTCHDSPLQCVLQAHATR